MSNSELKNTETASKIAFSSTLRWDNGAHKNERAHWLGRMTEWLFDFGGEGHIVGSTIDCESAVPVKATVTEKPHWAVIAVKVCLLATGIIPLLFVVLKAIYRAVNNVVEVAPTTKKPPVDIPPPPVDTSSSSSSSSSASAEIRPYPVNNIGNTCWFGTFYQAICAVEPLVRFIRGYEGDDQKIYFLKNYMEALPRGNKNELDQIVELFRQFALKEQADSRATPLLGNGLEEKDQHDLGPLLEWIFGQAGQMVSYNDYVTYQGRLLESSASVIRLEIPVLEGDGAYNFQELMSNQFGLNKITALPDCLLVLFDRTAGGNIEAEPVVLLNDSDDEGEDPEYLEAMRQSKVEAASAGQKICNPVAFPESRIIDLRGCITEPADEQEYLYELVSVVSHLGRAREGGHYTAEAKYGNTWYNCNDDRVKECANNTPNTASGVYFVLKRITFDWS